jgi:hypothetical protein
MNNDTNMTRDTNTRELGQREMKWETRHGNRRNATWEQKKHDTGESLQTDKIQARNQEENVFMTFPFYRVACLGHLGKDTTWVKRYDYSFSTAKHLRYLHTQVGIF